jgi:hypothetical protein
MVAMSETAMREFLANHPRMIGVLFAATLLMMEVGQVAGAAASSTSGP